MVADNPAGTQAASRFPPTRTVQAAHGIAVSPTIERIQHMKRAIVSVIVAAALLVTGVTFTSFNGISTAHALEDGGDE
jgi:hypothetical protein